MTAAELAAVCERHGIGTVNYMEHGARFDQMMWYARWPNTVLGVKYGCEAATEAESVCNVLRLRFGISIREAPTVGNVSMWQALAMVNGEPYDEYSYGQPFAAVVALADRLKEAAHG